METLDYWQLAGMDDDQIILQVYQQCRELRWAEKVSWSKLGLFIKQEKLNVRGAEPIPTTIRGILNDITG